MLHEAFSGNRAKIPYPTYIMNRIDRCSLFAKRIRFSGNVWPNRGFDTNSWSTNIVAQIYSSLVEQMLTKDWNVNVFFAIRDSRSSIWGMAGTQVEMKAERLVTPPHPILIFRGEICFELRRDTTWSCQAGRQNRDGAVSSELACLGSQAMVFIVLRVGASWI